MRRKQKAENQKKKQRWMERKHARKIIYDKKMEERSN